MIRKASRSSTVPLAEIEARIEDYLQAAEAGETIVVTRNGNPVAALIPLEDRPAEPKAGLASLSGGWEGSEELIEHVEEARRGQRLEDPDLRIAATAICHGLEVVTGNLRHFQRIPGLKIHRVLADARQNPA